MFINKKDFEELQEEVRSLKVAYEYYKKYSEKDIRKLEEKSTQLQKSIEFLIKEIIPNNVINEILTNNKYLSYDECPDYIKKIFHTKYPEIKLYVCDYSDLRYYKKDSQYPDLCWSLSTCLGEITEDYWEFIEEEKAKKEMVNQVIEGDKEWIHEKCGTNTPPTSIPKKPSVGDKKKSKEKQILKKLKKWATNHIPCDICLEKKVKCTSEDCVKCLKYDLEKVIKIIKEVEDED